jgi:murein DD-endopeptidase MepM/ murein hydrolase activator NlpD
MSAPIQKTSEGTDAYQQMEATMLRQLMSASGAFKPADVAGGQLRADLFIETLADAVAKGGGIGIARMLEETLGDPAADGDTAVQPKKAAPPTKHAPSLSPASPSLSSPPASLSAPPGSITSGFGPRRDPIDGTTKYHTGVDLRAPEGTPIRVAGDGVVRAAGPRGGYGNAVEIDHGGGLTTLYGHASELLVKPGEKVTEGQPIARVGQTGRATGPHLHYEVRLNDRVVDPFSANRALNAYQRRVEDTVAGRVSSPRGGETP